MAASPTSATDLPTVPERFVPRSEFMELIEYTPKTSTLDIHFKSGSHHRYLFFFPVTYQTFKESPDHDSFFSKAIRGKFLSVPIRKHTVGKNASHPLHAKTQRRSLDRGKPWIAGTVARALAGV